MLELIIILPFVAGALTFFAPPVVGRTIIVCTAVAELALSCISFWTDKLSPATDYFRVSPEGSYVLLIITFLFMIVSMYAVSYVVKMKISREPIFHACFLFFLGAMSMVCLADHIIVLWIAVEATTLVSAPSYLRSWGMPPTTALWKIRQPRPMVVP